MSEVTVCQMSPPSDTAVSVSVPPSDERLVHAMGLLEAKDAEIAGLHAELERERSGYQLEHEAAERLRTELAAKPNKDELWAAIRGRDEKINKLVKELDAARAFGRKEAPDAAAE